MGLDEYSKGSAELDCRGGSECSQPGVHVGSLTLGALEACFSQIWRAALHSSAEPQGKTRHPPSPSVLRDSLVALDS